jgi:hypothetical protein
VVVVVVVNWVYVLVPLKRQAHGLPCGGVNGIG